MTDPRRLRALWLSALARAADVYLRSPFFLVGMRAGLRALRAARAQRPAFDPTLKRPLTSSMIQEKNP